MSQPSLRNCSQNARELPPKPSKARVATINLLMMTFYYVIMGVVSGCGQGVPKDKLAPICDRLI